MQSFVAGQANIVSRDLVAKATGNPITTGTVNFYLRAISGANSGKWVRGSDSSWQSSEVIAGTVTQVTGYVGDATWEISLAAAAWVSGVRYELYAKESGDLHIPYSDEVVEVHTPSEVSFEATVTN